MKISFVDKSWEDYLYWQKIDKKILTIEEQDAKFEKAFPNYKEVI